MLQSNTYDGAGRLLQRVDGVGSGVKYEYDFTGAQRRMESMGGASQELEYDAQGRITGIVDGNGNETKYLLDEWGRITGVVKADGSMERYAYNFAGDIVSSTDGEGHTTRYEYNRMGKISAIVDPTGEKESYCYDGQGRLIRRTDRNGVTVELGYNLYGAPLFKKEKDSAQGDFYEYTPEGLLKCAISEGMRYAYEYDEMGRMIRKSASGRTLLALSYDKNGNKVRQTDVTGKLTGFDYDRMGQVLRLTDGGQELAAYTYNPDGTPRAVTHGPIRQEYTYDLDKNLTGLTVRSGDGLLSQDSYAYDGNGNRIRKQALEGTTLYQYDALNQLQRVDYPAYSEELFYDKAGNRARRLLDGEEELYQYDPRNRLMAYTKNGATTPFQYDNAGNLLQDDKARYSYDAFNRTVKVETFDGNVQVNRYDAEGLRHEMEENGRLVRFIFHKGEAVAEQEENSNVIRLIRSSELIARSSDSESARMYYHYASDEMGSTTHIVDENGNVKNRYAYDAWGRITAKEEAIPNRFTYYGQQIDPITQQYYLRARFYNPVLGRFTQEDTYRGDGLNLYAYCRNNPVYYIDFSGNVSRETILEHLKHDSNGNAYVLNKTYSKGIKTNVVDIGTPIQYRGVLQAHHLLQGEWARVKLREYGYSYYKAPTITLETNDGVVWKAPTLLPHNQITNMQNAIDTHSGTLQDRLILGAQQLLDAGIDRSVVLEALEDNYKMIDYLNWKNEAAINSGALERLEYSREAIEEMLGRTPDIGRKGYD